MILHLCLIIDHGKASKVTYGVGTWKMEGNNRYVWGDD